MALENSQLLVLLQTNSSIFQNIIKLLIQKRQQALGSRIRTRMVMESETKKVLAEFLEQSITLAGNPGLMTPGLIKTLAEQSSGNFRAMCIMAGELLSEAFSSKQHQLDEQLFFDAFAPHK